ncbi:MAG: hypothetical protein JXQ29_08550 [Planctomycetes bacterium]|nr:hypothetical protein [Planctomycetota bacterium]
MKGKRSEESRGVFIDFGLSSMKALVGERGIETALVRTAEGRLTEETRQAVRAALQPLVRGYPRPSRIAHCALPARGVSVRRFLLPPAPRDATRRLLGLQLEQSLPAPPRELAFGYRIFGSPNGPVRGNGRQDVVVLAVRRSLYGEYLELVAACGLRPAFTLGTLAASSVCPVAAGVAAVLDVGRSHTEWLCLEDGRPLQVRTLAWGGVRLAEALAARLGVAREEAERRLRAEAAAPEVQQALREAVAPLARFVAESMQGLPEGEAGARPRTLHLVGGAARPASFGAALAAVLGDVRCETVALEHGPGRSAVTLGLKRMVEHRGSVEPIHFGDPDANGAGSFAYQRRRLGPWLAAAAGLLLILLAVRYLPAFWTVGSLRAAVASLRQELAARPRLDRELRFIEHLEARRPKVLEALTVVALAAPKDAVLEAFSLNERGAATLQVRLKPNEHHRFRARLARSGWFSGIVLEDLKPAKPRHVSARLTATLTPPPGGLTAQVEARMQAVEDAAGADEKDEPVAPEAAAPAASTGATEEPPPDGPPPEVKPKAPPEAAPPESAPSPAEKG